MSNTQVKPKSSGSYTTIVTTSTGITSKSTAFGVTLTNGQLHKALLALNQWHNQPANATTMARAQKIASAAGLSIQEV